MGFLHLLYAALFFIIWSFLGQTFSFSANSLPTFGAKMVLEIFQIEVSLRAIVRADRSTFAFFRLITIPLLLATDIFLGYALSQAQVLGTIIVFVSLFVLISQKEVNKKGVFLIILSSINAVVTISLFKYNITHFNSLIAEQLITILLLIAYLVFKIKSQNHRNLLSTIASPRFQLQAILNGLASPIGSYAYTFSPASIITTFQRAADVFWSIISGNIYFKEHGIVKKLTFLALTIIGLYLIIR